MAVRVEVKRHTFKLEIDLGGEVDESEAGVVKDATLSFMESRACQEDDVPDGVDVADKLHTAAAAEDGEHSPDGGVGWKVGKMYAQWGDSLFKDQKSRDQLMQILNSLLDKTTSKGGVLFKECLKAILCDRLGLGKTTKRITKMHQHYS